jgi:hypothetical protein
MIPVLSEPLLYLQLLLRMSAEGEEATGTGFAADDDCIIIVIIIASKI